jgi:hypothetical protein
MQWKRDQLCGPVDRAPDYISRCPGFDYRQYRILWKVLGLENYLEEIAEAPV